MQRPQRRRYHVRLLLRPIDQWNGWQTPKAIFYDPPYDPLSPFDTGYWCALWNKARKLAKKLGWEGDIREGPYVTVLPNPDCGLSPYIAIGWKQDNNGTTFVASQVELPWFKKDDCEMIAA